jgi:hypothetical protein
MRTLPYMSSYAIYPHDIRSSCFLTADQENPGTRLAEVSTGSMLTEIQPGEDISESFYLADPIF